MWKLHCQILQISHSICVHRCHCLNQAEKDKVSRRGGENASAFSEGILMRKIWILVVWKDVKHQLHSSTATGGLPILNCDLRLFWACSQALNTFKKVKPPGLLRPECLHHDPSPALSRYNRHPPASLCSEPGAFCFCQKDFSKLLSSDADWLICSLLFLGNAHTLSGSRHSQLPAPNGTRQSRFREHPKIQDKLCWRKDSGILELQAVELCGYAQ